MTSDSMIYGPMAGILAMAFATYFTRVAGFWLMGHVRMTVRVRRMLETLPGAIVVATVVPLAAKAGAAGVIAVAVTVASMAMRRNEFLAVALGLIVISLARAYGV
jgi:branched chain amino acid efflux pump